MATSENPSTTPGPTASTTVTPSLGEPIASTSQPTASTSAPAPSSLDPASSSTAPPTMKEKNPTDSATALINANGGSSKDVEAAKPKPTPTTVDEKAVAAAASSTQPQTKSKSSPVSPTASSNTASTKATSSAPRPDAARQPKAAPASSSAAPKKKRKRSGFAGLLLALGCLSASEFEDTPSKAKASDSAPGTKSEKPSTESKAAGSTETAKDAGPGASSSAGHQAETTGTTLVGQDADKEAGAKPDEQVVVAPVEPVTLPIEETAGVTSSAVQPPGSGSELLAAPGMQRRDSEQQIGAASGDAQKTETSGGYTDLSDSDAVDETGHEHQDYSMMDEYEDEEDKLIAQGGIGIPVDENGNPAPLLPAVIKADHGRKCLVLDLDETLLHSSFKMLPSADYIVPVEIESQTHNVYVIKRPGVDHFLKEMGKIYEIVVFTASLSKYADPVLDMLDVHRVVRHRLFRESCYNHKGNYVKDLSQLGRPIEWSIIIDNSPASYIFHPNNAVPVSTWFNDPHDTELTDLCPFLTDLATVDDVRGVLDGSI